MREAPVQRRTERLNCFGYRREQKEGLLRDEGHELDVEEASDKPRRGCDRERVSEELQEFSLVISWLGTGVARVLRVNASEPTVGWRGEHPQSVGWMPLVIDKYSHTL
jgi:hypothetical protein